jgi:hypothetical protein
MSVPGHILGFRGQEVQLRGKACHPDRMFGVSRESPTYFYGSKTLVVESTYLHIDTTKPLLSQQKYIDIGYGGNP